MRKKIAATFNSSSAFKAFLNHLEHNAPIAWKLISCFDQEGAESDVQARVAQLRALCAELGERTNDHADGAPRSAELERLLMDIFLVYQFMVNTPFMALLILSTTILDVCGDELPQRTAGFQSVARTLRSWSAEMTREAERVVKGSPTHLECSALLAMGVVGNEGARALVELLKLMPHDLNALRASFVASSDRQLTNMVTVLSHFGVSDQSLYQLKALVDAPLAPAASLVALLEGPAAPVVDVAALSGGGAGALVGAPQNATVMVVGARVEDALQPVPNTMETVQMRLLKDCSDKTVYHKILKPTPTIELIGVYDTDAYRVNADLFRASDDPNEVREAVPYLEGERFATFQGSTLAVFKKLKISGTSTQIGGHPFQVRYQLMKETVVNGSKRWLAVPNLVVWSGPIHVYSHTAYLKAPAPQKAAGKKGQRAVTSKRHRLSDDDEGDEGASADERWH